MRTGKRLIYIVPCLYFIWSCATSDTKKSFYSTFSVDWDLAVLPLIEPFRLVSTDREQSWHLDSDSIILYSTENGNGIGRVQRFGISKNYFFGQDESNWFFYDTKTSLYATYKTENELISCLNSFDIPVKAIKSCREYRDDISKYGKCYWFPPEGKSYTEELELKPGDVIDLNVSANDNEDVRFQAPNSIRRQTNNIYFFRLNITDKENDLLYLGINWKSFILIKDGIIIPVFIDSDNFDITLYTPFPIAQQKGITEDKRIHIKRTVSIKNEN